jgi:plastocyanin
MRRAISCGAGVALAAGALGGGALPAEAAIRRVTVRQGPLTVKPYEVRFTSRGTRAVRAPRLDGFVVRMHARVVDARGRPMPVRRLMLHHIVYKNSGRFPGDRRDTVCRGRAESFYGTGEENETLSFPRGYGYRVRKRDRWLTGWMLMNHRNRADRGYIEYTATIDTSRRLRPVTPYWLRVTGCDGARDPIFNVPGNGGPGSILAKSSEWRAPKAGRIVAGGSHIHGGGKDAVVSQPSCGGRPLMVSRPLYGLPDHPYYNVLPVLHEPGPFATGWVTSRTGIPIAKGEVLRVSTRYDNALPHTRVMGIWHLYVAHDASVGASCGRLPADLRSALPRSPGRTEPPAFTVPLTGLDARGRARAILAPPGPVVLAGGTGVRVRVSDRSFQPRKISLTRGGTVRWEFGDRGYHDVTLANGPVGFASRWLRRGQRYTRRFPDPGTYRLFCSLHPIDMTQVVTVREGP